MKGLLVVAYLVACWFSWRPPVWRAGLAWLVACTLAAVLFVWEVTA